MTSLRLSCLRAVSAAALVAVCAPSVASAQDAEPLRPSLSFERVGGFNYSSVSPDKGDGSVSFSILSVGGVALNPYATPRLGVDIPITGGLTLGGSGSVSRSSLSVDDGDRSQDVGSLTLYTLTPRIGYTVRPHSMFDLSVRAGVMLAGGSVSDDDDNGGSVFSTAIDLEAVGAVRLTSSFNLLVGLAFDRTLSASASVDQSSSSGSSSDSTDIKGGLTTGQLWFGLGGYL